MSKQVVEPCLPPLLAHGLPRTLQTLHTKDMPTCLTAALRACFRECKLGGFMFNRYTRPEWWPDDLEWRNDFMVVASKCFNGTFDSRSLYSRILTVCYVHHKQEDTLHLFEIRPGQPPFFRVIKSGSSVWNLYSLVSGRLVWRIPSEHLVTPIAALEAQIFEMLPEALRRTATVFTSDRRTDRREKRVYYDDLDFDEIRERSGTPDKRRSMMKMNFNPMMVQCKSNFTGDCQHCGKSFNTNHIDLSLHERTCAKNEKLCARTTEKSYQKHSRRRVKNGLKKPVEPLRKPAVPKPEYLALFGLVSKNELRESDVSSITSTSVKPVCLPHIPVTSMIGNSIYNRADVAEDADFDRGLLNDRLITSGLENHYLTYGTSNEIEHSTDCNRIGLRRADFRYRYLMQRRILRRTNALLKRCKLRKGTIAINKRAQQLAIEAANRRRQLEIARREAAEAARIAAEREMFHIQKCFVVVEDLSETERPKTTATVQRPLTRQKTTATTDNNVSHTALLNKIINMRSNRNGFRSAPKATACALEKTHNQIITITDTPAIEPEPLTRHAVVTIDKRSDEDHKPPPKRPKVVRYWRTTTLRTRSGHNIRAFRTSSRL